MRLVDGVSKELQSIEMPGGGYMCNYLKVVVNNAKLYIRPLQADLSMEPCEPEVRLVDNTLSTQLINFNAHHTLTLNWFCFPTVL